MNKPIDRKNSSNASADHNSENIKTNTQRRHFVGALSGVAATGVAAAVWHKPVINSVVLPAHAQMSDVVEFFAATGAVTPVAKTNSVLDSLVQSAHAVAIKTESEYAVRVTQAMPGVDSYMVGIFERRLEGDDNVGELTYGGTVSVGASTSLPVEENPCNLKLDPLGIKLVSIDATEAVIDLTERGGTLVVPSGPGDLPIPMCVDTGLPQSYFQEYLEQEHMGLTLLNSLVPEAHAGVVIPITQRAMGLAASKINETTYEVTHLNFDRNVLRSAILTVGSAVTGNLVLVENACDGEKGSGEGNIPARIISADSNNMMIELTLGEGGSLETFEIPAGPGTLVPSCAISEINFTTEDEGGWLGKNILEKVVPQAHAGGEQVDGGLLDFMANADFAGGTNFDVEIVGELSVSLQQALLGGYNVGFSGQVTLGVLSQLTSTEGCGATADVLMSEAGKPNQFRMEVTVNGGGTTRTLRPGTAILEDVLNCVIDE